MRDGTTFKGMMKPVLTSGLFATASKRKQITGTGELKSTSDGTEYKGSLVKG